MIGEISVKETSRSQHIPLKPFQCFKGSKSSIEIIDIPDLIGVWKITGISASVHYPDGRTDVVQAKKVQGKYIATLDECQTVGEVKNGFAILASGVDEKGEQVQTFILGVGDVIVRSHDSSVNPQKNYWSLKLVEELPEHPDKGDVFDDNGRMQYWNGEEWTWNNFLSTITSIPDSSLSGVVWKYSISNGGENLSAYISDVEANVVVSFDPFVKHSELDEAIEELDESITGKIPTKVSQVQNDIGFVTSGELSSYATKSSVTAIESKIPSQATSSNQLADKNFVNSSITTATAYFKGTFNSVSELPTTGMTLNDYAFVIRKDAVGQTFYDRYKWNGTAWLFEYSINNSGFTAAQYAAINSGITEGKVRGMMLSSDYGIMNLSGEYEDGTTFSFDLLKRL